MKSRPWFDCFSLYDGIVAEATLAMYLLHTYLLANWQTNTAQQSGTDQAMQARPVLIPVSQGFPPRSLHPVYQVPTSSVQRAPQVC